MARSAARAAVEAYAEAAKKGMKPQTIYNIASYPMYGVGRAQSAKMAVSDAQKILDLNKPEVTMEEVDQRATKLLDINDPSKGGSQYLQGKVLSAREALEIAIKTNTLGMDAEQQQKAQEQQQP